jgi:hypothetical protein
MTINAESVIVALGGTIAVLGLLCAALVWDDWRQRDLAAAGRECRVEMATVKGRLDTYKDLLTAAHPACGGMGPVSGKR